MVQPTYVNSKQYDRILKRRKARAILERSLWKSSQGRGYLHESRHKHACRRKRGPGGRFLTKAELLAAQERSDEEVAKKAAISSEDNGRPPSTKQSDEA